eukprot:gene3801-6962_t
MLSSLDSILQGEEAIKISQKKKEKTEITKIPDAPTLKPPSPKKITITEKNTEEKKKIGIQTPDVGIPLEKRTKNTKVKRIVCISDTHDKHNKYLQKDMIPDGDILIHSGDFSKRLTIQRFDKEVYDFNRFLGELPHEHKIFVAGNHEIAFNKFTQKQLQSYLSNCTYLLDSSIMIDGIKFFGSPWTRSVNMGYSKKAELLKTHWKIIERDTDILITHSPSFNILDLAWGKYKNFDVCEVCGKTHPNFKHWGDYHLGKEILSVKPKVHIFGHVHDDAGYRIESGILRINAAMDLNNKAYYFDYYYE